VNDIESMDRGHLLYSKHPSEITKKVLSMRDKYFSSKAYSSLKNNVRLMDSYIDSDYTASSHSVSDIVPPTVRRNYNEFVSLFNKFLETEPLFSIDKTESVQEEQRRIAQMIVNDNLSKSDFRENVLNWNIDDVVRYGTSATYTFATDGYNSNSLLTVQDDEYGDYRQVYQDPETLAMSMPVHPLNTIIDPKASFQTKPDYIGFVGEICLPDLKGLEDNPNYIGENIRKAAQDYKNGNSYDYYYTGDDSTDKPDGIMNITYLWCKLPITGNESDPTWYAVEIIGDYIVRIEANPLDENTVPLAVMRVFPRKYQWFGVSPLLDKICVQNLQHWLINTQVESTARMMDRIVLYHRGKLDVDDINARHRTGGIVPVDPDVRLDQVLYGVNMPSVGFGEAQSLMEEMRRQDQETSMIPNFNPQSEGGPTNKTLGGAQMMASIGEMRASSLVGQMAIGLKDVAKHHIAIMRNISDDVIQYSGQEVPKSVLLGKMSFSVKISNVYNYMRESLDSENRLNNLINRRATGIPQFKAVPLGPMIKDSLRNSLKRENIGEYVDEELLAQLDEADKQSATAPQGGQNVQQPQIG